MELRAEGRPIDDQAQGRGQEKGPAVAGRERKALAVMEASWFDTESNGEHVARHP